MNNLTGAVRTVLSKYATFTGRASRGEFWWWVLAMLIVMAIAQLIDGALIAPILGFESFDEDAGTPLSTLLSLAVLLPAVAVGVRRLHDTGKSGWWLLLGLIPLVGLVLIYFYAQPGEAETNAYGEPQPFNPDV